MQIEERYLYLMENLVFRKLILKLTQLLHYDICQKVRLLMVLKTKRKYIRCVHAI